MTFTPPTKRTHGQCTCRLGTVNYIGHMPDCPALYPLQPQPGDNASKSREPTISEDVTTALSGVPDGQGGAAERAAVHRLAARIAHLEARLKDYERTSIITNDHQTRALRMGQQQGRVELAQEVLEWCEDYAAPELKEMLAGILTGDDT